MRFDSLPRSPLKVHIPPQSSSQSQHLPALNGSWVYSLAGRREFLQLPAFGHWLIQREVIFRVRRSLKSAAQNELPFAVGDDRGKQGGDRSIYQR